MARVVVVGGSMNGQATALMLARDGHEVAVLERDAAEPPDAPLEAWETWERKGVPQFHQAHLVFPRFRMIVEAEFPELLDDMLAAGMVRQDYIDNMPPFITDRAMSSARRSTNRPLSRSAGTRSPRRRSRRGTGPRSGPTVHEWPR